MPVLTQEMMNRMYLETRQKLDARDKQVEAVAKALGCPEMVNELLIKPDITPRMAAEIISRRQFESNKQSLTSPGVNLSEDEYVQSAIQNLGGLLD